MMHIRLYIRSNVELTLIMMSLNLRWFIVVCNLDIIIIIRIQEEICTILYSSFTRNSPRVIHTSLSIPLVKICVLFCAFGSCNNVSFG